MAENGRGLLQTVFPGTRASRFASPGLLESLTPEERAQLQRETARTVLQGAFSGRNLEAQQVLRSNAQGIAQKQQVNRLLRGLVESGQLDPTRARALSLQPSQDVLETLTTAFNLAPGTSRSDLIGEIANQQTTAEQNVTTAGVEPTSADGRSALAGTPGRNVLESFTVADIDNPENRRTVVRTPQGIFEQTVDAEGRPAFRPVDTTRVRRISTQEQGTRDELGTVDRRELEGAQLATISLTRTANDALKLLDQDPSANTLIAGASGIINSLQQEGRALANALDKDFTEDQLNPARFSDTFSELGINNARLQGIFTSLAFQAAAASGQTSKAVSDTDIKRFLRETGASSSDPETIRRVVTDLVNRTQRNFRDRFLIKEGREFEGAFPPLFGSEGGQSPRLPEGIPADSRPTGRFFEGKPVFITPDGREVIEE